MKVHLGAHVMCICVCVCARKCNVCVRVYLRKVRPLCAVQVCKCASVRAQNSLWHRLVCCVSVRVRACVHKTAFAIAACDVQWMYVYVHICMCIKILYINFV